MVTVDPSLNDPATLVMDAEVRGGATATTPKTPALVAINIAQALV